MISEDHIYHMDCLEGMREMADGSVDAVIADLPYGVLNSRNVAAGWDRQLPLEALWREYLRITKPESPVILFAQGLFSARLMLSPGTGASSISMAEVICRISVLFWLMTELMAARIALWSGSSSSVGELWQYLVP